MVVNTRRGPICSLVSKPVQEQVERRGGLDMDSIGSVLSQDDCAMMMTGYDLDLSSLPICMTLP